MNIFLPYEHDIDKSVKSLDDRRLVKQILECKVLLDISLGRKSGYANHPVSKHYKNSPGFLIKYGIACCKEFEWRFHKIHQYDSYFSDIDVSEDAISYVPFYVAGSKNSPDCIRTTENVSSLFQEKLRQKWNEDTAKGRPPKWTNREISDFYTQ